MHNLAQENHEVKTKYNELLQNHQDMKREIDIVKPDDSPPISMQVEPQVELQVSPIQHEQYKNTIRFLQAKNAELSRVITTKPVKSSTKVVPRGSKQSFKIMADKHPMTDGSHNILSSESTDGSNNSSTNSSNNPVKSRHFNPGFGYHYPSYLDGYGYHYPGYLGRYGHHYLGGYGSD